MFITATATRLKARKKRRHQGKLRNEDIRIINSTELNDYEFEPSGKQNLSFLMTADKYWDDNDT